MENNIPFKPGQEVVCVETDWEKMTNIDGRYSIEKDLCYTVDECDYDDFLRATYVKVDGMPIKWRSTSFAPVISLYSDITSSLAQEALEGIGDKADSPVREIKQLINN